MTSHKLNPCCLEEAKRSLARHRDVATCDRCGRLLLAYGDGRDYRSAIEELTRYHVPFETGAVGELLILAKPRTSPPRH